MNFHSTKCLVVAGNSIAKKVEDLLLPDCVCEIYERAGAAVETAIRELDMDCAVFYLTTENFHQTKPFLERVKAKYTIPLFALVKDIDLEIARSCGQIGVNHLIEIHNLRHLPKMVYETMLRTPSVALLEELGAIPDDYPIMLQKALHHIEKHYISLLSISELADAVGLNECVLSRLFKKYNLAGPKKILMRFKLRHALNLMSTKDLSIKKIAESSGFSNEKRFIECFSNTFHHPPNRYLKLHQGRIDLPLTILEG